ncbi:MAG: DUF1847 domain-containing protein [Candidatus Bathyarchaeia archaeon]
MPQCAKCPGKFCYRGVKDPEALPSFCPMKNYPEKIQEALEEYGGEEVRRIYPLSAMIERDAYNWREAREGVAPRVPVRPRIREVAEFCKTLGAKRVGVAFCIGLSDEASRVAEILEKHGLEVCSVLCKCGAVDKEALGAPAEYKIRDPEKPEVGCNPIIQAELLNASGTEVNVIVGLCVGHDMLFTRYSKALVTTLIVKDRFTGHNPVISLYTGYHSGLVMP